MGGPSCGGTTMRRFPPTRMLLIPSSKPAAQQAGLLATTVQTNAEAQTANAAPAKRPLVGAELTGGEAQPGCICELSLSTHSGQTQATGAP